jgi:hypothetical protein
MAFSIEEVHFLAANQEVIARSTDELELSKKSTVADMSVLHKEFGEYARAVAELVTARRAGLRTHKFPRVEYSEHNPSTSWLVDTDSIQQATPDPVARFRAAELARLGIPSVHDVTCSVGIEGAALTGAGINYVGSDIDRIRLSMARHNVSAGHFFQADALSETSTAQVILADPARRAGGRRISSPQDLLPPLPDLVDTHREKALMIKCAPGLDFSEWDGGVTVTSLDGGVKEACLYSPQLATARRAVLLASTSESAADVIEEYAGDREDLPQAGEIGEFIIDPDGAVVRAGLVKDYAAREGLWQLDDRIAYLTGPQIPAGRSGFRFIEEVPIKKLKSALSALDCGRVEILVRGVDIDPDLLRKKLKLRGSAEFAVIITRIGTRGVALICHARQWA